MKIVLCIFLLMVLVQGVLAAGIPVGFSSNKTTGTAPVLEEMSTNYWAPWITKTSTTSATINWWQETNGTGIIKYANASYYNQYNGFDKTIADAEVTQYHHVLLTGLDPNTSYKYWVKPLNHETVFNNRTFRTMPVSGPFTFIVISDTHANENRFRYVADALNSEQDALFILDGGDFSKNDNASIWTYFFDYGDGMLANYTIYTNIGNHEYHNIGDHSLTDAYEYRNAFDYPLNYSFDCAGIRFVVLDSPDPNNTNDQNPTLAHSESQVSWLKDQLDNNMSGTFVIDHHPIWTYGRASSDSALQPWETLFQKYPISAYFAGHIHSYQRFSVNGTPYFIVANGGGGFISLSDGKPFPPSYIYGATKELGYLKVTVDPANNMATANEYFVASLPDYNSTTGTVINPPLLADSITFPLKINPSQPEHSVGVFRNGTFYLAGSKTNGGLPVNAFNFGMTGDLPVAGDWNADGNAEAGIFRSGNFFLASSNTPGGGTVNAFNFGQAGDVPVAGKWSGSGVATVGIFRSGKFFLASSNTPGGGTVNAFNFGQAGDTPIAGDWNGDGTTTVGIFRNGLFALASLNFAGGGLPTYFTFGQAGDVPVTGDWNADGKTEVGVFRNGVVYLASSNTPGGGTVTAFTYGMAGDAPVAGKWT